LAFELFKFLYLILLQTGRHGTTLLDFGLPHS
jgi:hypothetical protein